MSQKNHLNGHLQFNHTLSPQEKYKTLPLIGRILTVGDLADLWEMDCSRLPSGLEKFRRKARTFAEEKIAPIATKIDLLEHLPVGEVHPDVQNMLIEAGKEGWLSYFLPSPLGSMPWNTCTQPPVWLSSLVVEEFSRVCGGLMLLLSAHHLGCMPLLISGQKGMILDHLRSVYKSNLNGTPHLVAFAITEPQAGSDVEEGHGAEQYRPGVVATPTKGGYVLNGRKCFISGGDIAKSMTLFAALDGEGMESWTCFYVDTATKGVSIPRIECKMGMRASGAAEVEFNNVFIPTDRIVGGLRQGWVINRATLNYSRIPVASMGLGMARAATEEAIQFARTYRLGGKILIDYQHVQLQLATMVAETRAIRSLIWQEASNARKPRQLNASLCKFHATDRAQVVCEMAMDLLADHGGLHEQRVEKIFRDLRLTRIFEGTNQINQLSLIEDWQGQLLNNDNNYMVGV